MKKLILSLAVFGVLGYTGVQAASNFEMKNMEVTTNVLQEKTKIDPENLPELVKEGIQKDDKLRSKTITEAHQQLKDDQMIYVVKFDKGEDGEEVTKKFDGRGEKVKD